MTTRRQKPKRRRISPDAVKPGATVLDVCCSVRSFWFDKIDPRAIFSDRRRCKIKKVPKSESYPIRVWDIKPDVVADFRDLPFKDSSFNCVVFDPPHIIGRKPSGNLHFHYGVLKKGWEEMLRAGFSECFRVLKHGGILIFKWAETSRPVSDVLRLTEQKPLFGHKSGKKMGTHWVTFMKGGDAG